MKELTFYGPFKFLKGENYLFNSQFVKAEGVYLWTIKDELNKLNLITYIGETVAFGKRQKEHVIQITGLNYRIIDPRFAVQGIEKIIWNGMWRDRTPNAVSNLLDNYEVVNKKVIEYIGLINIYFAPTSMTNKKRRHIEGMIGWNLRNQYPHLTTFYPADNHIGKMKTQIRELIRIIMPERIDGIDTEFWI